MASENLATTTIDPWVFKPTSLSADSWFSDLLNRDADSIITKALQKSIANSSPPPDLILHTQTLSLPQPSSTTTTMNNTTTTSNTITGKISKRKSRATKRSNTTFITADPANFRQMVQQVTGVRFGSAPFSTSTSAPILKPEPQRACSSRFPIANGCLPTLDTSAFLLDQPPLVPLSSFSPVSMGLGGVGEVGLELESLPSFPTLESWKVM
ncbi:calmodulin-binding protein 25 [Cannabis sativa]|uniref:calmodulin-binding protein 25 n=1 Tax=Cannabis sativa TaxID=3483 RepID=UPI0029C9FB4E|nr:calmodulin-binding protein 25 [Cannabis sativa]